MLIYLIQGATYGFAAAVQPGPLSAYLVAETLHAGWRRTIPAIFAPLISDGPVAAAMLLLLSQTPAQFLQMLSLPGGFYVLHLAVGAWRNWRSYGLEAPAGAARGNSTLFKAVLVNLLNPNCYLGWSLVLGPMLLRGWREAPPNGIAVIASFYATMIATMGGIVMLSHGARNFGRGANRALIGFSALALAAFALVLIGRGTRALFG
jgi:threonine/homoserine/homoserine lactone efflux protein